jgi:plastocyanin
MTDIKIGIGGILIAAAVIIAVISFFYTGYENDALAKTNQTANITNITNQAENNSVQNQTASKEYIIEIKNSVFSLNNLTIKKGDVIKWTNKDGVTHTITSDKGKELGSSSLIKDENYTHKFQFDGIYNYHCEFHSNMKGQVVVEI